MLAPILAFLVVTFASPVCLSAKGCSDGDLGHVLHDSHPEAVQTLEDRWLRAYATQDTMSLNCILARDFQIGSMPDITFELHDRRQVLEWVAKRTGSADLEHLQIQPYSTAVVVRGTYSVREDAKVVLRFQFTDFFVYRDHRWQAVARTLSELPVR